MHAGKLRHRVTLEAQEYDQDDDTGEVSSRWVRKWVDVPAAVEPLSVREFLAAQQTQSEVVARITIRYRDGINSRMRVRIGKLTYAIVGVLPDADSGREYLTLACSAGISDGE